MQNEFYKVTCNLDILDGDEDLIFLEKWLEKCLKIFFLSHCQYHCHRMN